MVVNERIWLTAVLQVVGGHFALLALGRAIVGGGNTTSS